MASKSSIRSLQTLGRTQRRCCQCSEGIRYSLRSTRQFSSTPLRSEEQTPEGNSSERPRWSYTPIQMKAPFHPRHKNPEKAWNYTEEPAALDAMYIGLLGRGGDKVLSDEVKWLAITHKSYDQGRRGFNDRLAFFGKRILLLQTSLALLNSPSASQNSAKAPEPDAYGRTPFQHPAFAGLSNISPDIIDRLLTKERTSLIADSYGIGAVTRWKPANPANLIGSGSQVVYTTSLYGIIGALALQKGGMVANEIVRSRILPQLGIGEPRRR